MLCPAIKTRQRGMVHLLSLVVLAVVLLAGLAILTRDTAPANKDKNVLGVLEQSVETRNVASTREHNVFGLKVKTSVTNVVSAETGEVLEVKPSLFDWIVGIISSE